MTAAARFQLSVFGDEIASDLDAQIASLHHERVRFIEARAMWGTNILDLSEAQLQRSCERLATEGIGVSAVASPVGKVPVEVEFEGELVRFRRAMAVAHRVGARFVRLFSFVISDARHPAWRSEVIRRLAAFAREAEAGRVLLALENESYVYGDTPERCLDLIEAVGSPALRFAFDPANFVQVGVRPYADAWRQLKPYVVHLHIKDAVAVDRTGYPAYPHRVPATRLMDSVRLPGEGQGDLRPILRDLAAGGYQGFLTIEPHLERRLPDQDGPGRFGAAVAALRRLLEEIGSAAE